MVLFNGKMALEVAIEANSNTMESGNATFTVSFLAKRLFRRGASHVRCFVSPLIGIADAAANIGVGWGRGGAVFSCFKGRTGMDIFMKNEVVEMMGLAHVDGDLLGIELLGYKGIVRVGGEAISKFTDLAQPALRWEDHGIDR